MNRSQKLIQNSQKVIIQLPENLNESFLTLKNIVQQGKLVEAKSFLVEKFGISNIDIALNIIEYTQNYGSLKEALCRYVNIQGLVLENLIKE